ncbi:hypothetical protein CLOP_g2996 [Closterium sp. NIES-67]|nr:hypothetical protein CLOP_g2996 [Closterium sp. NIES-67]
MDEAAQAVMPMATAMETAMETAMGMATTMQQSSGARAHGSPSASSVQEQQHHSSQPHMLCQQPHVQCQQQYKQSQQRTSSHQLCTPAAMDMAESMVTMMMSMPQSYFESAQETLSPQQCTPARDMAERIIPMMIMQSSAAVDAEENSCRRFDEELLESAITDAEIGDPILVKSQAEMEDEATDAAREEATDEFMAGLITDSSPAAMPAPPLCSPGHVSSCLPTSQESLSASQQSPVQGSKAIGSSPLMDSPMQELYPFEAAPLGKLTQRTPQQMHQQIPQQEAVFCGVNVVRSLQAEVDPMPPVCAAPAGIRHSFSDRDAAAAANDDALLSTFAGSRSADTAFPGVVYPWYPEPCYADVASSGGSDSDWLAAADNAIASFLIEAALLKISTALLQPESTLHFAPMPPSSLPVNQEEGSLKPSVTVNQEQGSMEPSLQSRLQGKPMPVSFPAPTATAHPALQSATPSLLPPPPPGTESAYPLNFCFPSATAQPALQSVTSSLLPPLPSSTVSAGPVHVSLPAAASEPAPPSTVHNPSHSLIPPLAPSTVLSTDLMQFSVPAATAQPALPSTVCNPTPSLLPPLPPSSVHPCVPLAATFATAAPGRPLAAAMEPWSNEAVSLRDRLKPDELFEAWCSGSFSRVLHGYC